ncbi:MAG TPA: RHS repeat-associated core domain-containing protein [Longimicrobium sp.]|uniref:RHS repeat-associated core domain-containing protein n=1 Tax=Longimicrobium sp. TaxID=2029185 RepID=UPI002ED9DD5F
MSWPGWSTTAWHEKVGQAPATGYEHYWTGSLAVGMRDASGQMYMRNRYYDPQTGQFTQADPIGLAGGLNAYGFAAGDPVSYSDPFGLCPQCVACAAGAISDVAIGYGVSRALGGRYSGRDVAMGLVAGCAGGLIGQFAAGRHLRHLRHARHADNIAQAGRIADVVGSTGSAMRRLSGIADEINQLTRSQDEAMHILRESIEKVGLEYGEEVTIDGTKYLVSAQAPDANDLSRALAVGTDGKVKHARVREINGRYEVVR